MTALSLPLPFTMPWPADEVDPSARVPRPPSDAERARRRPTPLWQAVLLAGLLHLWAALLLGSVPPGSAAPGQGVWGAINLRLQAQGPGPADAATEKPPPLPATGPPGDAAAQRWGGAVRTEAPAAAAEPGAARLGDWAPVPALGGATPALPPVPTLAEPAAADLGLPGLVALPAIGDAPEPPRLAALPAPQTQARTDLPALPRSAPLAAPVLPDLPPPPSVDVPLARLPTQPVAPAAAARASLRPLTPLTPLTPIAPASPAAPALATPSVLPELPSVPAPDGRLPAAPRLAAPAETLAPLAPSTLAAAVASPAELPSLQRLQDAPALQQPPAAAPTAPQAQAATASPSAAASPAAADLPPAVAASPSTPTGLPDAGTRTGADIATAPSAPASAPRLNLQLPRSRGGELSRLGSGGVLAVMPRPPELKSKLAREIEKTSPADCRTAHAQMGLLAVVPLAVDALKNDGGCRW